MRGRKNLFFHHHFFQRHRGGYFSHDQGPAFGSKVITAANWKGRRGKGWCRKTYLNKQLNSSISVFKQMSDALSFVFDLIGDKNSGHIRMLNPQPPFLQMIKKRTQDYYKVYYNPARFSWMSYFLTKCLVLLVGLHVIFVIGINWRGLRSGQDLVSHRTALVR